MLKGKEIMNNSVRIDLIDILQRLTPVIFEDVDVVDQTDILEDLGFDSINIMQLVVEVEEHFGIEFDDTLEYDEIANVGKLIKYVEKKLNSNGVL